MLISRSKIFQKEVKLWLIQNLKFWQKVLFKWQIVVRIVNQVVDLVIHQAQGVVNKIISGSVLKSILPHVGGIIKCFSKKNLM
ncbi:hypothetical protein SMN_1775 [Sulfurospirillum multivorans]|uniref:Transposase n=1 Tax=Sulfurospirillum multivorans TaxID=66821 RepID=A0ABX5Z0X8_SULMU|nr:hypothetical protein SMN_1775 [Sulfurospirillum multivorans]